MSRGSDRAKELDTKIVQLRQSMAASADVLDKSIDDLCKQYLAKVEAEEPDDITAVQRLRDIVAKHSSPALPIPTTALLSPQPITRPGVTRPAPEVLAASRTESDDHDTDPPGPESPTPITLPSERRPAANPHAKRHVVVVDDEPLVVADIADALRAQGYLVRTAKDGIDALDKILKAQPAPDLIILDIGLPYLSGIGVIEALKTTYLAEIPRLIVSAGDPEKLSPDLRNEYAFVRKPFLTEALLLVVRRRIENG